ncbi:hypothetical protein K474DRAFT_1707657 [Panus rudis PR-1116 ss-1]|nr:hypothetical protein K474DRAFT_1707657 [Panus rudis PR-1116 ss-1]
MSTICIPLPRNTRKQRHTHARFISAKHRPETGSPEYALDMAGLLNYNSAAYIAVISTNLEFDFLSTRGFHASSVIAKPYIRETSNAALDLHSSSITIIMASSLALWLFVLLCHCLQPTPIAFISILLYMLWVSHEHEHGVAAATSSSHATPVRGNQLSHHHTLNKRLRSARPPTVIDYTGYS